MQANSRRALVIMLGLLLLAGCNLPFKTYAPGTPNPTDYVMTLSALQTKAVMTATAEGVSGAPTQAPIPVSGGTPGTQMVTVINDTLCWRGPGPAYETVSALFKDSQVLLLGRTVLPAWYIVRDPIYLDPCWAQASDLQVDQSVLATLPVYPIPSAGLVTPFPSPTPRFPTPTLPGTGTFIPPTLPAATGTPPPPTPPAPTPTAPQPTQPPPTQTAPAPTATPVSAPSPTQPAPTATTSAPTQAPTSAPTTAPTTAPTSASTTAPISTP